MTSLYPYNAQWSVDLAQGIVSAPLAAPMPTADEEFEELGGWVYASVLSELLALAANPGEYNERLSLHLPNSERFGRVRRRSVWEILPNTQQLIRDELTTEQRRRFADLAPALSAPKPLGVCTVADYLRYCAFAYAGAGYDVANLDPEAQ